MAKKHTGLSQFSSINLVRNLFGADLLNRVLTGDPRFAGNRADAFQLPRGLTVADEVARAARIAHGAFLSFCEQDRTLENTVTFVRTVLTEALGYRYDPRPAAGTTPDLPPEAAGLLPGLEFREQPAEQETAYPVTAFLSFRHTEPELPLLVIPPSQDLDKLCVFPNGMRKTPFNLMQQFLDNSGRFFWAIVTNGTTWRLLRDSTAVALSSYLDISLGHILSLRESDSFAGFYRLLHASRPARQDAHDPASCLWEQWRKELEQGGERVRAGLSGNVQQALRVFGCGFLEHPRNDALRQALESGSLPPNGFYNELLRLVYRFIFLFVMEERGLLHAHAKGADTAVDTYRKGYSMARLVQPALASHLKDRHEDIWQSVLIVFSALGKDGGEPLLALPGLGGLFDADQCSHLQQASLSNKSLYAAMRLLRWSAGTGKAQLLPIDYRNMDSEELGSVYEELLELTPQVSTAEKRFFFTADLEQQKGRTRTTDGNKRKSTGSYYTPPCLVELLVNSALAPLIAKRREQAAPGKAREALLSLRIIDPACGSGHFLLSAARHLAQAVAEVSNPAEPERHMRRAMHEVVSRCIYGVDLNPMAVELVRMNLWLEGYLPNKPLSFLDDHLVCGNSLLGLMDLSLLDKGIPAEAYTALPGDDKAACKALAAANRATLKEMGKRPGLQPGFALDDMAVFNHPEDADAPTEVKRQQEAYRQAVLAMQETPQALAADAYVGAFIMPKSDMNVPVTSSLQDLSSNSVSRAVVRAAAAACREARVMHWPLVFPTEMQDGGFDCVLANPPWEKNKLQEQEWFANRYPAVANAAGATRRQYIDLLAEGKLSDTLADRKTETPNLSDKDLHRQFIAAQHLSRATSQFYTAKAARYPLTGQGDVNLYALFAETCCQLCKQDGHVGILVPSGISTDANTSTFFSSLTANHRLMCMYDFENKSLFPNVHKSYKFSAVTLAPSETISAAFFLTHPSQLQEPDRKLAFTTADCKAINPNTGTIPIPRCKKDLDLLRKLYAKAPVLLNKATNENPWGIRFCRLLDMTNDSGLFLTSPTETTLPLYEGKSIHLYDHRYNTFEATGGDATAREVTELEKQNTAYEPSPRYWVERRDVISKLPDCCEDTPKWFIGFRDICRATDERTLIMSFLPFVGVGHTMPLIFLPHNATMQSCFISNANSLVVDYVTRMKVGGVHMTYNYLKQFPFLPPDAYTAEAVAYITERVVKLTYTSESMRPFAEDMGYQGDPIVFDDAERAVWRAELDAVYAKLYGLTRDELAYILDPTTHYKENCPTVTFPTLKANEEKAYGEYRTKRLVLEAYDREPDFTRT